MALSTQIPESVKIPLFYFVPDNTAAGGISETQPSLLVGQMLSTTSAPANIAVAVGSLSQAQALFGAGSHIERMFASYFTNNTTGLVYALPLADPAASIAATGAVTITASPTASGVITLYIGGQKVAISAYTQDTVSAIATRLAAAINSVPTVTVTALATAGVVALTSKNKGDLANDAILTFNLLGSRGNEQFPSGFAATLTQLSGGTGQPDFTAAISNIASMPFTHVAMPYSDEASLEAWDAEFGFQQGGRWAFDRANYGWIYNSKRADYADALAFGAGVNSIVISTMVVEPTLQSPVYAVSAAYCGVGSYYLLDDPARPLQTLQMNGLVPAPTQDRFSFSELNNLTSNGLAVCSVNANGVPMIVRETMQYQKNAYAQSDTSYGLMTTLATLAEIITRMKASITTKYPRSKLAPDGTRYGAGQAIVTPSILAGELIAEAIDLVYDGLLSDITTFTAGLIVEIDDQNPTRVNVLWPGTLMSGLRQFVVDGQFRLNHAITA